MSNKAKKMMFRKTSDFVVEMSKKGQSHDEYMDNRNAYKPEQDNAVGKYGEVFAAHILHHSFGFPLILPDFTIRTGKEKGWYPDLPYHEKYPAFPDCHVKTCNEETELLVGQQSWTFQWKNPRDPLFDHLDSPDLIIFMYVTKNLDAKLVATAPWHSLQKIPRRNQIPILPKYWHKKCCFNYNDLVHITRV